jgi:[ribosomal protein S18]-alanine N-acetyltransferase
VIQLRSFEARDLPALHQLDRACFAQGIAYSKAELQYFLTQSSSSCWVAEQPNNRLVGFVIIERASLRGSPAGHIVTLDVDPVARRHGLGTLLMQTAEEQMKQEGAAWMTLEVAENNTAARHFYRNLGFVTRGKIARYYGGTIDAEVMEKAI